MSNTNDSTLTSSALLELCTLPPSSSRIDRTKRLQILHDWAKKSPSLFSKLLSKDDQKSGCFPLHWAAGTGFDEAVSCILNSNSSHDHNGVYPLVNQQALYPSTGRTPLHYAARNGHCSTCALLVDQYQANPNPKCSRGAVNPLQLATWQNRLSVVQYLVQVNGKEVVLERNDFNCGLMHWIGMIPHKRWESDDDDDDDGSGVIPLVQYLSDLGVGYTSTPANSNSQGHTPLHKAAWGGNLSLLKYFRDVHSVYDCVQDVCGNYGADLANMQGHANVHRWLLERCSTQRRDSCLVLGLDVAAATDDEIKRRYAELARVHHPDKKKTIDDIDIDNDAEFVKIKDAYEHLTKQGGVGRQKNPKHEELRLLTMANNEMKVEGTTADDSAAAVDMFSARILTIISDYGEKGFPISMVPKRWNQVWPDRPFPSPDEYVVEMSVMCSTTHNHTIIQKKVKLLKFLKWKCTGVKFRKVGGVMLAFKAPPPRPPSHPIQ